jgi:hypothetical protein
MSWARHPAPTREAIRPSRAASLDAAEADIATIRATHFSAMRIVSTVGVQAPSQRGV